MVFARFQKMKQEAGYFWGEKKKEFFFALVATFALGQVLYRDMANRGYVNSQRQTRHDNPTAPLVEARRRKKQQQNTKDQEEN